MKNGIRSFNIVEWIIGAMFLIIMALQGANCNFQDRRFDSLESGMNTVQRDVRDIQIRYSEISVVRSQIVEVDRRLARIEKLLEGQK